MFPGLTIFSAVSMSCFGLGYLFLPRMREEFERYRLRRWRRPVAWLQLAGALGLVLGLRYPLLGTGAAAGLTIMMLTAVGVRVAIGDALVQLMPALLYMGLNLYLLMTFLSR